jgi:hypothetical protein
MHKRHLLGLHSSANLSPDQSVEDWLNVFSNILDTYKKSPLALGFCTGNPQVSNWHTVPAPADTIPVTGMGMPQPVNRAVLHKTHSTLGTHRCVLIHSPCNHVKAMYTSSDMYCVFHKGWVVDVGLVWLTMVMLMPHLHPPTSHLLSSSLYPTSPLLPSTPLPLHVLRTDHLISFGGRARRYQGVWWLVTWGAVVASL